MRNKVNSAIVAKGMRIVIVTVLAFITPSAMSARMSYSDMQSKSNNIRATMLSVNNSNLMQTGSQYSSEVYEVGSSAPSSTSSSAPSSRPRRSGFNDITVGQETEDNFQNPQQGPIGEAVMPLMLMAAAFGGVIAYRRRRLQPAE